MKGIEKKEVFIMDDVVLEGLVKEEYKVAWCFSDDAETVNGHSTYFRQIGINPADSWHRDNMKKFLSNSEHLPPMARILLNDLVYRGKLQQGNYLILCEW